LLNPATPKTTPSKLYLLNMKTLKKALRVFFLTFLILFAAAGAGMLGAFLPNFREQYMDKEIRIEQVDKKKTEDEINEDQE
jgi:hypothetical protein